MADQRHTCPRRRENFRSVDEGQDQWDPRDDTCTYCGSFNPDKLMQRLEAGDVELGPTDKSYKAYLHNAGGAPFLQTYRTDSKPFAGHFSTEHDWVTRETSQGKFYFQHLSDEQQERFVGLLNEKKLKIGYPGHFYALPFFIVMKPKDAA